MVISQLIFLLRGYERIMVLVYGDESMDETSERVCAVAGIAGLESQWKILEEKWVALTGGIPFHAKNCDSDQGDYASTSHQDNKALYRDMTTLLAESGVIGVGIAIDLMAARIAFQLPYRAFPDHLGSHHYSVLLNVQFALPNPNSPRTKRIECVVDSGVSCCLLHADIATFLGLDLKSGRLQMTNGIGGAGRDVAARYNALHSGRPRPDNRRFQREFVSGWDSGNDGVLRAFQCDLRPHRKRMPVRAHLPRLKRAILSRPSL